MDRTQLMEQASKTVSDVLSLFRDKTVSDVLDPDTYPWGDAVLGGTLFYFSGKTRDFCHRRSKESICSRKKFSSSAFLTI